MNLKKKVRKMDILFKKVIKQVFKKVCGGKAFIKNILSCKKNYIYK